MSFIYSLPLFKRSSWSPIRYLGSALSMLFVPNLTKHFGPKAQFVLSGLLALAWQAMWSKVGADNTDDIITGGDSKTDGTVTPVQMDEEGGEYIAQPFNDGTTPLLLPSRSLSNGTGRPSVRGSSRSLTSSPPVSEMNTGGVAGSRVEVGTGGGVPWGVMIQSSAVWAIVANNFAFHYATYVLMNWIPTYFESHVGAPLSDMGDQYKVSFRLYSPNSPQGVVCHSTVLQAVTSQRIAAHVPIFSRNQHARHVLNALPSRSMADCFSTSQCTIILNTVRPTSPGTCNLRVECLSRRVLDGTRI